MSEIEGKVWRFGDNVDTDQIIPAERLVAKNLESLNEYIFEKVRPGFAQQVGKGDIIVAGKNFGCGSSREHAPLSLIQAGVSCVVAESFARIFYRNSMNIGLLLVECKVDTEEGKTIKIDTAKGEVISGETVYNFPQYPKFISEMVRSGGLMNLVKENRL